MKRIWVIALIVLTIFPITANAQETNETLNTLEEIQNELNDINQSMNTLQSELITLNSNLENLTKVLTGKSTGNVSMQNRSITEKIDYLLNRLTQIIDAIGQPTSATGEPINATLFSALSAIAIELYEHRDALKTLGENQKNLSKYDQEIINRMDDRTQLVMQKIENESTNTVSAVNGAASQIMGSNNIAAMASLFSAFIVAFFIIYELILKKKFGKGEKQQIIAQPTKPECFGNPVFYDPNDETCKSCLWFEECGKKAFANAAIQEIHKEETKQESSATTPAANDYLSKFGINI